VVDVNSGLVDGVDRRLTLDADDVLSQQSTTSVACTIITGRTSLPCTLHHYAARRVNSGTREERVHFTHFM